MNADHVFLGEIRIFPYGYAPDGFLPCDGQVVEVSDYTQLYALIGNKFGGNGPTNFGIPNLNIDDPHTPFEYIKHYIAYNGVWPERHEN